MGYGLYIGLAVAALVGLFTYIYLQTKWFWLTDLAYRLPIIGKISLYAGDPSTSRDGWLNSETKLCSDYANHCDCLSKEQFDTYAAYLRKCSDNGRRPRPLYVTITMVVLIASESAGFAYLLSSFMAMEGSENIRLLLTSAIVLVLAFILFKIMEYAGQQLYVTRMIRKNFDDFRAYGAQNSSDKMRKMSFQTKKISLNDDQAADDDCPPPVQFANRVLGAASERGSYLWLIVALIIIAAIAGLSTMMRIEAAAASAATASGAFFGGGKEDASTAVDLYATLSSFWLLAVIFVATQLLGIAEGYQFTFCGKESHKAFNQTEGAPNYESYFAKYRHRMQVAEARLASLHQKAENQFGEKQLENQFLDFVREQRATQGRTSLQDPGQLAVTA